MHPARVRSAARQLDPSHPGASRAGCRAHGRGVRGRHRSSRGGDGHQWAGRDQHGHPADGRVHGLDSHGVHHRSGAHDGHRHRRVPGVRHGGHHAQRHQAQRVGHDPAGAAVGHPPGVPHRHDGPPGTHADRRAQGRVDRFDGLVLADRRRGGRQPAGLPPEREGSPAHDQGGRQADHGQRAPRHLRRRRHPEGARGRGAASAGRADGHPRRHHVDGPRRVPRLASAVPGHAGHARQRNGDHRAAEGRPADHPGRPVRRPDHRQGLHVRTRGQGHPRRHRPGRAGQGAQARRAHRRRLRSTASPRSSRRSRICSRAGPSRPTPAHGRAASAGGASSSRSATRPANRARR